MEEDSSDNKWNTHRQKEGISQELQHIIKKETALEQTQPSPPVLSTVIKDGFIPIELDPGPSQKEHTVIKESLLVVKPEHEGLIGEVYNRQCYVHGQELSVQEETQVATLDSLITINSDSILDRSSPGINTDVKEKFFIGELIAQPTVAQRCKLENESECELSNINIIHNNSDSTLFNTSVVIKEELILEDTDEERLIDKWFISNTHSDICEEMHDKEEAYTVNQREPQSIVQLHMLTERNADKQKSTNIRPKCCIFDKHFAMSNHLADRKLVYSGIRKDECDVCHKTFTLSSTLSKHQQIHNVIRKYECDVCHKTFTLSSTLSHHKQIHNEIRKYECGVCHKTFTQLSTLSRHKQIHSGIRKYECDVCHKTFTQSCSLSQHKQIHRGIREYECEECHKTFTLSSTLSQHKQIHSGIRKYECDECHKTFTLSSTLSQHKQIHSGIRKYECDVCHKTFTQLCTFSQHKQIHSGIRKYACDECHKTFTQSSTLSRHKQIHIDISK